MLQLIEILRSVTNGSKSDIPNILNKYFPRSTFPILDTIFQKSETSCLTDINRHLLPELASTIWNSIESVFQEGGGEGCVRDLQLPESRPYICQIPVYRTNKMKNTVTGKNVD